MPSRAYYSEPIANFIAESRDAVLGRLVNRSQANVEATQRDAWLAQIDILKGALGEWCKGHICFEFVLPRMGRRIDALLIIEHAVFVIEFKVGESAFGRHARDQVWDYALDLKNFHEPSHAVALAPVLVATKALESWISVSTSAHGDGVLEPTLASPGSLSEVIRLVLAATSGPVINSVEWEAGRYNPTPTIVEAAMALYGGHTVEEISRSDAGAVNLRRTSASLAAVIESARHDSRKVICFVTGVPGAGKTLVGLDIATRFIDRQSELYSVFLSGNGPLVAVLRESLARDDVLRAREAGRRHRKGDARRAVEMFIQNVHHFRDECLLDELQPPPEHVAIFDEAQRAWTREQTSSFMSRKKGRSDFDLSEPEFLISCLDRHPDWAVVICLVGGGQEINTGEAGVAEWIQSIQRSFPHWHVELTAQLFDDEYGAASLLEYMLKRERVTFSEGLHLQVSMRSFRAERVSQLIKQLLDVDIRGAHQTRAHVDESYPIVITRDLEKAKQWLRSQARGSERYGLVASSQALRLKPHAIDVRSMVDPVHWFLDGKDDVRSSYYLEDAGTEFQVQGLELDWSCVVWDGDFRMRDGAWEHWSFVGDRWQRIRKAERQLYLKNAYRVLLTRARQGMVIVVPNGQETDATRQPAFYDGTFAYLQHLGLREI